MEFGEWIFTDIRENEAHYLPYILRNTLLASNQWGAARVLPTRDPSMDLTIQGTVLSSDGQRLTMWVEALDSAGRVWLQKNYADESLTDDYPVSTRYTPGSPFDASKFTEPFQDIYDQINNDLVQVRQTLSTEDLINIKRVSQLVYASDLSPESFAHNLGKDENGRMSILTLPAEDCRSILRVTL